MSLANDCETLQPLQPLQPYSLSMAIARKLRERILMHQLPPGSYVNDGALAQEFGVSRTPVREALKLLCHEGLLTAHVRRGMTVTVLSDPQVREVQELCTLLATHLQRRGAQPGDPARSSELTDQLFHLAQSRLKLAFGPDPAQWRMDTPSLSHDQACISAETALKHRQLPAGNQPPGSL